MLSHALSPDQAGGWLGADAAALYVWELLMLRAAGQCPDAVNGKAMTWLAFLDLESFFDRVWRKGLLYQLWNAGVRGKFIPAASCAPLVPLSCLTPLPFLPCWPAFDCGVVFVLLLLLRLLVAFSSTPPNLACLAHAARAN